MRDPMEKKAFEGHVHEDFQGVAQALSRILPKEGDGGAAICVFHRGECVVDVHAGTRDRKGSPWEADTLALSWSTTKGVLATLLHLWVDRRCAAYDDPVARYWPEFATAGKGEITLRQILCHEAGLHRVGPLIGHAREMLDWEHMVGVIEKASPVRGEGDAPAYHGLTFGWLVGELIQRIGGADLATQIRSELAEPLALDGLHLGLTPELQPRRAEVIERESEKATPSESPDAHRRRTLSRALGLHRRPESRVEAEAALLPRGFETLDWNAPDFHEVVIPAVNGFFTARSLAGLYARVCGQGAHSGGALLSSKTRTQATEIQNDAPGRVIPVSMRWRLGYHSVAIAGGESPHAFGHFGLGGSGAWADPERDLAVALVLNSGMGTPFGDSRIIRVNSAAVRSADRRALAA